MVVLAQLEKVGLLLQSDRDLPSVAAIVMGEPVRGSWWGHKKGHEIFRALKFLDAHPDALLTRLVSGKVTYLHRRLWPNFLAIAMSTESWQTRGLSPSSRRLLGLIQEKGELRLDKVAWGSGSSDLSEAARALERRLLVYSDEIHTERGTHTKILTVWARCPKVQGLRMGGRRAVEARGSFEQLIETLNAEHRAKATLPWKSAH